MFGFQNLDAYRCAVRFLAATARLLAAVPRGHATLTDQLRRAALSVPLNVAEGSGRPERDGRRHYGIARGSALECAAILDALEALGFVPTDELVEPRALLERVVSMLSKMARP